MSSEFFSAGSLKIRLLDQNELEGLSALLASEARESQSYFWQDRSPHFLDIYRPLFQGEPLCFGAFHHEELVGSSVLYPISLQESFGFSKHFLDTDLFVKPNFRNSGVSRALLQARGQYFRAQIEPEKILYYGIEQTPGHLQVGADVATDNKMDFLFPASSVLEQIFLTDLKISTSERGSGIHFASLDRVPQRLREEWREMYHGMGGLRPKVDEKFWDDFSRLNRESYFIWQERDGHLDRALMLSLSRPARIFRRGAREALIFERLRRKTGRHFQAGEEVRFSQVGFQVGDSSERSLLEKALEFANQAGADCLSLRDAGTTTQPTFSLEEAPDQMRFERRLLVVSTCENQNLHKLANLLESHANEMARPSLVESFLL